MVAGKGSLPPGDTHPASPWRECSLTPAPREKSQLGCEGGGGAVLENRMGLERPLPFPRVSST